MTNHPRGSAYTAKQGRRFALTLAVAFALIAAFTFWRSREGIATVSAAITAILLAAGITIPSRLEPIERGWMKFAALLSRVTTPIFMGIMYFLVLTPAGVIRRTFGRDPLDRPLADGSYWV
jgi:hypothetical protein